MRVTRQGFTLIELMVVVAILGVLAAVAIPSFSIYMKRSKSAEAPQQLKMIFNRAAYYFQRESAEAGIDGMHRIDCIVGDANNNLSPDDSKQQGDYTSPEWLALAYSYHPGYFRYEVVNAAGGARCHVPANTFLLYTFRALGDLDDDDINSTFDLAVGSNEENELYHARSMRAVNGYE